MPTPISKIPVNLAKHLRKTVTAHQAVREGIATAVQKQHAARLDARREMAANAKLFGSVGKHGGSQ